jgi:putative ABC transport system ATP-binding protein
VSALELRDVSKTRGTGRASVTAISDVTLAVTPGEFVLLEGPSGSGKTTLLAVAAGLLSPTHGEVTLAGRALGSLSPEARRHWRALRVGFVFQRPNLMPALSARENVVLAGLLAHQARADAGRETDALLERLGVAPLAARRPGELSGGEEQRVAVARALVHRPSVVLADEPTANLDGRSGLAVAESLRDVARERGAAVLVATHDSRLEPFATRRVRIVDGRLE